MEFNDEILQRIVLMGAEGFPPSRIAKELNLTPDKLKDERLKNEALNDAMNRAEFNYRQIKFEKMIDNPTANTQRSVFEYLANQQENNTDNKIIVEIVDYED